MKGSSPLTRGKPGHRPAREDSEGLIPAHAGKTCARSPRSDRDRAHPRSRGENSHVQTTLPVNEGSSPLTRGKRRSARATTAPLGAHPRSRGENGRPEHCSKALNGSSPLTRGKHFLTCAFIAQIGQILESLELCASSESYSSPDAYATDALQGRVRSIGLAPRSSRGAS